ncbi:Transcriptional regulatory protein TdiR [Hartmannibacter diazotrophicus]|uniref:Transcriptional regulatory protein TdiR n=1 Tax=Hartmannibacter diazotrophicus TaxID=1482074 RepID=A0A2C9D182_9HYPH|nr:response regulator [Hartmannibacter diazotrophicus]SON54010.1 Transcriptional regulatory protein TdiR [Hartmannibacter diazotrophicus]
MSALETHSIIAIIDDEESVRRGTSSLLRSFGFKVRTFVSAEEFLACDCARAFACIVSDVHMEGMSGLDLHALLRSRNIDTPLIFITAFADEVIGRRLGGDVEVLQKPFQAEALLSWIRQTLS